jgi:hypothetical protein
VLFVLHCAITICDVLLSASDILGANGTWNDRGYDTTTFTRFPGLLLVPDEHADQVVGGVGPLEAHQVVVTVTFDEVIPVKPSPLTQVLMLLADALQSLRLGVLVHEVDPRTIA